MQPSLLFHLLPCFDGPGALTEAPFTDVLTDQKLILFKLVSLAEVILRERISFFKDLEK